MSTRMPFQIHIPRRNHKCTVGHEPITEGMCYHSILYEEGEDLYRRSDICEACWEKSAVEELLHKACTQWKSSVPNKEKESASTLSRKERALEMLREGLAEGDPIKNMVLALFLQRKKFLHLRQELERDNGDIYQLYEVQGTDEMLAVKKISLSAIDTERVQQEILQSLGP